MQQICDLHIHSRFSGGASKTINLLNLSNNCKIKGVQIVGTGDCLHPSWLNELKDSLTESTDGIFTILQVPDIKFVLQTEVEIIWKDDLKVKKIHFIILFPNFEKLEEARLFLSKYGNLGREGRPKLYKTPEELIIGLKTIDNNIEIIPAHIFTPYYGVFGYNSQFKTLKEALGYGANYINAIETGLSADPAMVRVISELNKVSIISNSDSHSVNFHRIGREATVISLNKINYHSLIDSIKRNKIVKTYEFKPSQGKYYYDGHRAERHIDNKDYFCSPKLNIDICPYCRKKITKGVLSRVQTLSDQTNPFKLNFQYIMPLLHLISIIMGGTEYSKRNLLLYKSIISNNGDEYAIWEGRSNFNNVPERLAEAVSKIRNGKYWFIPGHDSVYGKLQFVD
jgi:uncharacterized protein (TIGR00375 family)